MAVVQSSTLSGDNNVEGLEYSNTRCIMSKCLLFKIILIHSLLARWHHMHVYLAHMIVVIT